MGDILYLAPDLSETAQIRRLQAIRGEGHRLRVAGMRKGALPEGVGTVLDLGPIGQQNLPRRTLALLRAGMRLTRHRRALRGGGLIIARNLDMLILAHWARVLGAGGALVYEVLDIHGMFTRPGLPGRAARWVERRMMHGVELLAVSSPGFITGYFGPMQGFSGVWHLLENRMWFPEAPIRRPAPRTRRSGPLVLGWVGAIRCQPSLDLLCATAQSMPRELEIAIHGTVHRHALPDFDAVIGRHPNIRYHGAYAYPEGLAAVYAGCDLVWAQDLWQRGANSDWLLPNRIYEAAWFGCPALAVANTQTGQKIARDGSGFVIASPEAAVLREFLRRLDRRRLATMRRRTLSLPEASLRLTEADMAPVLSLCAPAQGSGWAGARPSRAG